TVIGPPLAISPPMEHESHLHTRILYPIVTAYYAYRTPLLLVEPAITHRYQTRRRLLYFLTDCSSPDNQGHPPSSYPLLLPMIDKPLRCCPPTSHKMC